MPSFLMVHGFAAHASYRSNFEDSKRLLESTFWTDRDGFIKFPLLLTFRKRPIDVWCDLFVHCSMFCVTQSI